MSVLLKAQKAFNTALNILTTQNFHNELEWKYIFEHNHMDTFLRSEIYSRVLLITKNK